MRRLRLPFRSRALLACPAATPITYLTWWEMFPTNNIQFVGSTVKPGDNIAASVVRKGTNYTLKVTDSTTKGNSFTASATCAAATCKDQSAEWIGEAPSSGGSLVPMPKFTCWTVTNATVNGPPHTIKSFPDDMITMDNAVPDNDATPGPLNPAGSSFRDCPVPT